jgi:hypothetical protein
MILKTLAGLSLLTWVSVEAPVADRAGVPGAGSAPVMSTQQKGAAVHPLVLAATECVARSVSASPRFAEQIASRDINDLIVEAMASCVDAMRAMIDAFDRMYGMGSGEAFFAGPYLDVLPAAVHSLLARSSE